MTREVRPLARALSLRPVPVTGVHRAWKGTSAVAAAVGIGPRAAARGTVSVLETFPVERVVVVGVAGAVDPALRVTDVLIPDQVVDRATGTVFRPDRPGADGVLVTSNAIGGALAGDEGPETHGPGAGDGGPETLGLAVAAATEAAEAAGTGAASDGDGDGDGLPAGTSAVDMETAAIARVCEERGVRWSAVRTISDVPGTLDDTVLELVRPDGGLDLAAIARLLARRPSEIRRLVRIGFDTQRALRALTMAALREL